MRWSRYLSLAALGLSLSVLVASVQASSKHIPTTSKSAERNKELASFIETLQISVSIGTAKRKRNSGISNLLLYVTAPTCIEPEPIGPDGKPMSAHAKMSEQEAKAFIDVLAAQGFLEKANKFHSNRTAIDKKFPSPADSTEYNPSPYPNGKITLTIYDDHWYTYYENGLPEGKDATLLLNACKRTLSGKAAQYMQELCLGRQ